MPWERAALRVPSTELWFLRVRARGRNRLRIVCPEAPRWHTACVVALAVTDEIVAQLVSGDRRTLAQAITLVESTAPEHAAAGQELLRRALPYSGRSLRVGISGVPGVGKSTFVERFGMRAIRAGLRPAVLAVDPSSSVSGGSILGDKTRMQKLAAAPEAFVRPSPSSGELGGVARRTREAMLLCEAAGHDLIVVETVGVGQSEIEVASMTDFFLLLLLPNAGDDLQGIKKGVLELADCFVVNKADADPTAAERAAAQLRSVMQFIHPRTTGWQIPLLLVSALQETGFDALDTALARFSETVGRPEGAFAERRRFQNRDWMEHLARDQVLTDFYGRADLRELHARLADRVMRGEVTAVMAAEEWVRAYRGPG